jgi:hypothetical protein
MQVPESVLMGDEEEGKRALKSFVDDLVHNRLEAWRRQIATFARIDLDDNGLTGADVYFFEGPHEIERVPDGPLQRLRHRQEAAARQ